MKRITAIILALAMCAALCACGNGSTEPGSVSPAKAAATPAPEYVYVSEFSDFLKNSKNYFSPAFYTDDGFYATSYEKVGEDIPEGAVPEYEGQFDVYASCIYYVDSRGNTEKLINYTPVKGDENNGHNDFYTGSSISGMLPGENGELIVLENVYSSWNDAPGGMSRTSNEYWDYYHYEQKFYLRTLRDDGTEISCATVEVSPDEYLEGYNMKLDDKGNIVCSTGTGIRAIAPDGSEVYRITTDSYIDSIVQFADGRLAAAIWDNEAGKVALHIIDSEKKALGESFPVSFDVYNAIPGDGEYALFFSNGSGFYGYKLGEEKAEKLFSWLDCDVNGDSLGKININADGSISSFISEWDQQTETYSITNVTVKKVPYDSVPHKEIITIATVGNDYYLNNKIAQFNRGNDKYRIQLRDYSEYSNEEDGWDAGQTKLYTEIMAGDVPDMFSLSLMDYRRLASSGVLEDLYPYLDSDSELSREDFFPNILGAMEQDGKLCTTVSGVSITTLVGASSTVGATPGWTYDQFNAALARMPDGCTPLDNYVTRSEILQSCLALDMNSYVDWVTGDVNFNSDSFIKLLEFSNTFPAEFDWENYDWENEKDTMSKLAAGEQMLVQTSIYSVDDAFYNNYAQSLGGNVTYIGYPTMEGTGNMLNMVDGGYAMSSKCRNKDVAWQFLREFFTADYQLSVGYGIPSNINAYSQQEANAATIEYQKDDEGNYILDGLGQKIPIVKYSTWDERTQEEVKYYCMSEEQLSQLRELVTTTTKVSNYNSDILKIVADQAEAFFSGQKSAADVAKLIQSKAHIYVNEQR